MKSSASDPATMSRVPVMERGAAPLPGVAAGAAASLLQEEQADQPHREEHDGPEHAAACEALLQDAGVADWTAEGQEAAVLAARHHHRGVGGVVGGALLLHACPVNTHY